jgi:hypothetical protein
MLLREKARGSEFRLGARCGGNLGIAFGTSSAGWKSGRRLIARLVSALMLMLCSAEMQTGNTTGRAIAVLVAESGQKFTHRRRALQLVAWQWTFNVYASAGAYKGHGA